MRPSIAATSRTSDLVLRRPLLSGLLLALGLIVVAVLIGGSLFGSVGAFTSFVTGFAVHADRQSVDLGLVGPDDPRTVQFRVRTLRAHPVTITGIRQSCGCVRPPEALPVTLAAWGTADLNFTVRISPRDKRASFNESAVLYFDTPSQLCVLFIRGRIARSPG